MSSYARRLKLSLAAACGCALLISGVASALGGFLDGKPDWFELACNETACTFWLVLDEGKADQVSVNVGDPEFTGAPRWILRMPANRYLSANRKTLTHVCEQKEPRNFLYPDGPSRSVLCDTYVDALNLRLGDLNDTFVANGTELNVPMHISGEDGADYLRSARGKDTLKGGNGNDLLRSGAGIDTLFGEADDDTLDGSDGADVMDCGGGNDKVQYQGRTSALNVTLDDTANDGASGENDKVGASCENVEVWNGADKVVGSASANKLYGNAGNDTLKGGGGSDRLYGGDGKDSLFGEAGNDQLNGDAGDDTIDGGSGTDTVYGGAGNDTINAKDGQRDTIYCGTGDYDAVVYDAGLDEIDIGSCERR